MSCASHPSTSGHQASASASQDQTDGGQGLSNLLQPTLDYRSGITVRDSELKSLIGAALRIAQLQFQHADEYLKEWHCDDMMM